MNIHENTALLDAFLDDELTAEGSASVEAHLAVCPDCRAYVDDGLAIRAAFPTEEAVELPADFKEHVMAAVANAPQSQPKKQPWGKLIAAAACLAVIVLVQHGGLGSAASSDTAAYAVQSAAADIAALERSVEAQENGISAPETALSKLDEAPAETAAACTAAESEHAPAEADETELPTVRLSAAEVGDLLADFTPEEVTPDYSRYRLTRGEFDTLAAALAERDIAVEEPSGSEQLWLEVCSE